MKLRLAPAISVSARMRRRAVIASVIGTGLEWFDFLSYAYFAQRIAANFFPMGSSFVSLLLTFLVFALGFIVRPLGGVLIGLYADRRGRRGALMLLSCTMAAGSLMIGIAPTYAQIGLAAPLLVTIARLLQGFSTGGEFGTASAMLVEYASDRRTMLYGSFQMCAQGVAVLAASLSGLALMRYLDSAQMMAWGWRIPFLAGALVGPAGLYIRYRVSESPVFLATRTDQAPAEAGAYRDLAAIPCGIGLVAAGTTITYLWHIYLPVYAVRQLHLSHEDALLATTFAGALAVLAYPAAGWTADRIGALQQYVGAVLLFVVLAWPLYAFATRQPSLIHLITAEAVATILLAAIAGPHPGLLTGLFPVGLRSFGVSLSYNVAVMLFGGLAPATVTWLIHLTGNPMMPALYQIIAGLLSLVLVGTAVLASPRLRLRAGTRCA